MKDMLNILNFFSEKKRLFAFLAVALIVIAIPLTVFISKKQQVIKQRASGKQISLYFANSGNCNTPLTSMNLMPNQSTPLSLCLSAGTDYIAGISGFNITLSSSNSLTFQSANTTTDADRFGSEPSPQRLNQNKAIHFTRILTSNNISDTPLRILDFTALTTVAENGNIAISTAEIASLTQDELLTVENPALAYNSTPSSSTATPTPTPIPTLFDCEDQTGDFEGQYQCRGFKSVTNLQCDSGYTKFSTPASFTRTSCPTGQGCCKKNSPVPTPTPVSGAASAGTTLSLGLKFQDKIVTDSVINVNLVLDNLPSRDAQITLSGKQFQKSLTPGAQYTANVTTNSKLAPGKYYIFARQDDKKMIGRNVFTVSDPNSAVNVPTIILTLGGDTAGSVTEIGADDYTELKRCIGKSISADASCVSSDFDGNATINQIDYNIWIRANSVWQSIDRFIRYGN